MSALTQSPEIRASDETEGALVPRLEVGEWIEVVIDWLTANLSTLFGLIREAIGASTSFLTDMFTAPDALVLALVLALIAWALKDWKMALLLFLMLTFVVSVDQWENAMYTLSVVLVAAGIALIIGIPVGILAARSEGVSNIVRPVMDLMQTMPAFVWLVPVVMMFSIGVTPGVIATIIFCLPPGVRFTELGIRQVDSEVVEAGHAFGSTPGQILRRIQLPLALPTIMAGVNQVIMLALSMAVIAGLVGAGGLGGEVTGAIGVLDVALGFEAGLSVVVLAIYLDRITAAVGARKPGAGKLASLLRRRRSSSESEPDSREEGDSARSQAPPVSNQAV